MEVNIVTRACCVGAQSRPMCVANGIKIVKIGDIKTQPQSSLAEYEAGCALHNDCYGHMCSTPDGTLLVPQSLASKKGVAINEYLQLARVCFDGDSAAGTEMLRKINLTKYGKMRQDILGTAVSGSARLIIIPSISYEIGVIMMPRKIAMSMTILYTPVDEATGMLSKTLASRSLRDGDYVILTRPPSLTYKSDQPMRVKLWDEPTLGVSIYEVGQFHGDFDGDEMHMMPVYNKESVAECESWAHSMGEPFEASFGGMHMHPLTKSDVTCIFTLGPDILYPPTTPVLLPAVKHPALGGRLIPRSLRSCHRVSI